MRPEPVYEPVDLSTRPDFIVTPDSSGLVYITAQSDDAREVLKRWDDEGEPLVDDATARTIRTALELHDLRGVVEEVR